MKTYDDSVRLQYLSMQLESDHSYKNRSDAQIISRRWKKTEQALRMAYPLIRKIYRQLGDEVVDLLKDIDFSYDKLNKYVSPKVKRYVEDKIESWGSDNSYLNYLINTHTWTYKSVLKLLLMGLYVQKFKKIKAVSYDVFKISAVDVYTQSVTDRQTNIFSLLTLSAILSLARMPVLQSTYIDYLQGLMISQCDEMESFILVDQMQNIEINADALMTIVIKQTHRILKVNEDKYSGGLEDATRAVANNAYTYETPDDQMVRFIAEIDKKTTKMCRSLNDQLFYVHKENVFERYSEQSGGMVEVRCNGLVQGLNMPPISDHFHWCRSTLTYQTDLNSNIVRMMKELFPFVSEETNPKTYDKLVNVLKQIDRIKKQYGFKEDFKIDPYVEVDGEKRYIDGKNVLLDPKDEEILYAFKFQNEYGRNVAIRPRTRGKNAVQVSDYFIDSQPFDLKSFDGNNKRTIARKIKASREQAENFIVKVKEGSRTPDEASSDIRILKNHNDWVKTIYLFDKDDNLVEIFK